MTRSKGAGGLGLRDVQCYNDAFLAKLSWRLLNNPSCLLSRILKGKYFEDTSFIHAQSRSVQSHGWRSILIGRDLIMSNAGWIVGDGKTIDIWKDPWLSCKEQQRPMGPAPEAQQNLKVEGLFLPHKTEWSREAINSLVPF